MLKLKIELSLKPALYGKLLRSFKRKKFRKPRRIYYVPPHFLRWTVKSKSYIKELPSVSSQRKLQSSFRRRFNRPLCRDIYFPRWREYRKLERLGRLNEFRRKTVRSRWGYRRSRSRKLKLKLTRHTFITFRSAIPDKKSIKVVSIADKKIKQRIGLYNVQGFSLAKNLLRNGSSFELKNVLNLLRKKKRDRFWLLKNKFRRRRRKKWRSWNKRANYINYWAVRGVGSGGSRIGTRLRRSYRLILNSFFLKKKFPRILRYNFSSLIKKVRIYIMLKRALNNYFITAVDQNGNVKVSMSVGNIGITTKKKKRPFYVFKPLFEAFCYKLYCLKIRRVACVLFFFFNRRLVYDVFYTMKRSRVKIGRMKVVRARSHGKPPRAKKLRRL